MAARFNFFDGRQRIDRNAALSHQPGAESFCAGQIFIQRLGRFALGVAPNDE